MPSNPRTRSKSASGTVEKQALSGMAKLRHPQVIAVDLFAMELSVRDADKQATTERGDINFGCSVRRIAGGSENRRDFLFVNFDVGREPSSSPTEAITASYLCFLERDYDFEAVGECAAVSRYIVNIAVWPRFKDLLGLLVTQGSLAIPRPPVTLDEIAWVDAEDMAKSRD